MQSDEEQIRAVVDTWMEATRNGDLERVLPLMTDDAVFLLPGVPVMRKADFEAAAGAQGREDAPTFDGSSDIQEIRILGDWAFMWQRLTVVTTPADGGPANRRWGHTLSIFRKQDGRWRLARDANLLGPEEP